MAAAVEVRGVQMRFGALAALAGVDLTVAAGERRAVIGPNGAGKTTLFHIISGELRPTSGTVRLLGTDVTGIPPHRRARMGLGRTFQRNNLFLQLTVWENVRLAVQVRLHLGRELFRSADAYPEVAREADLLLAQVGLGDRRGRPVAELSYGEQRQLELALALATRPAVLLLDEPTAGTSPGETARMVELLAVLPREITLCIIEHDMDVVAALADNITVMHYGQVLADGPAAAVRADPRVQAVYLGTGDEDLQAC
ncbi:MAG: ABC transporter ATP-binding protein [Armatimonadota bacterium]|nr:ABC transporter ATP-binding protein [Armatimonadota bacterium]MDR7484730.1 ABC transporter ATP-binding protein [Armatimonadota bacterium]MDR7534810.1 ABC transporter ATP-binding protein [Armatimonadota bacterium]